MYKIKQSVAMALVVSLAAPFAIAGSLQISPELDASAGNQAMSSSGSPSSAPLQLSGYAKWERPAQTLEMVGYGVASNHSSFGSDVPISQAISLIVPQGWSVYAQKGVDKDLQVTWKDHGEPWTVPLRSVLRQAGLIATVNWPHRAILLRVRPVPKVPPLDTAGYEQWNHSSADGKVLTLSQAMNQPSLQSAIPVYSLNKGTLILTDLKQWASVSGWTVVWNVPEDWEVPNTTSFTGGFQKAVTQVVQDLSSNGANIRATFHTANNTVVIEGAGGGNDGS